VQVTALQSVRKQNIKGTIRFNMFVSVIILHRGTMAGSLDSLTSTRKYCFRLYNNYSINGGSATMAIREKIPVDRTPTAIVKYSGM